MKAQKIIYWIATGVLCAILLFSSGMYFFNYEQAAGFYRNLGFPTWIIYPSATVKLLAVAAILTKKSAVLKEWAYAGVFYDVTLAFTAHMMAGDGAGGLAAVAIVTVLVSYVLDRRLYAKK